MKYKKIAGCVLAALFLSTSVEAQGKWKFGSQNYLGVLEGGSPSALQLQTINGFRSKTWFAGLGTGIDYYFQRSIPLFVSVAKYLPEGKLPFFVSGDIGINFPWIRNDLYYFQDPGTYSASFYWAGGLGYQFRSKKRTEGFLLNLGYSFKHLINETNYTIPCLVPPCPVWTEKNDYRLRRLSLKVGWMF